jgi:hypothetical protein
MKLLGGCPVASHVNSLHIDTLKPEPWGEILQDSDGSCRCHTTTEGKVSGMAKAPSDARANMLNQLEQDSAEGWNPNEGDTLVGVIQNIKASQPNEYGIYPIVTVATDDGTLVAVHCFHTILRNRLLEKRPAPGESVAIKYLGEKESKTAGRSYHNYAVVVDRPTDSEAQATWDAFTEDADTDPEIPFD